MNKQRKTSHILNVFQYDADGHVVLPASLTLSIAPGTGDNNSKVPTTAWVRTYVSGLSYATSASVTSAIAALVDAAPSTLDTLNELAAALGDDPNFATTVATSIGGKLALTGGTLTGDLTLSGVNPRLYFTDTDNNPDYFISNTDGTFTVYDVTNSAGRFKIYTTGNAEFTNNLTAASFIKSGGTAAQFLKADGSVDGNTYLTGITSSQVTTALGFTPYNATNPSGYITGITSNMVTTALGYTPYNSTNPSGYITGITSANVTTALGYTPYNSTNPSGYITSSGTAAAISQTVAGGSEANLVYATIGDNDFFRIRVGGASNAGFAEIATADDGTEPIYVRQYTGVFSSLTRTLTLLDGSGNTSTPGSLNVGGYLTVTGAGSSSSIYMSDSDEGQREIHCNSNRIGFLTQAGSWGAWCDDSGNWNAANFSGSSSGTNTGDQTNISGKADGAFKLWATSHPNDYYIVNNWTGSYWQLTTNHGSGVQVAYANSAGSASSASNADTVDGYHYDNFPGKNGNSYYQVATWLQLTGTHGLYCPSVNNAHFYPQNLSYGVWRVEGSKNGWTGIHFGGGNGMTLMMNETEFGFHREGIGWSARFTSGTGHFNISGQAASISGQANSATINATSGNAGNQIVLRDGNGDISIGTLNTNHAYFGSGGRGLTSADTYGSYGNVHTYGTGQNNWSGYGIHDNSGYRTFFMSQSGNFGLYGQSIGKWAFYYGNSTASYAIGSDSPVAGYTLYLIYGLYTVGLYNASDARMKKDIKPLTSSLDKVKALRGVSYEYIDKGEDGTKNKGLELGFIAQEVLPVIPELIRYDEEKGYAMNYNGVSAVLVEAIKEQQAQIEDLKNKLDLLIQNK
jgi:hypothetical protein